MDSLFKGLDSEFEDFYEFLKLINSYLQLSKNCYLSNDERYKLFDEKIWHIFWSYKKEKGLSLEPLRIIIDNCIQNNDVLFDIDYNLSKKIEE